MKFLLLMLLISQTHAIAKDSDEKNERNGKAFHFKDAKPLLDIAVDAYKNSRSSFSENRTERTTQKESFLDKFKNNKSTQFTPVEGIKPPLMPNLMLQMGQVNNIEETECRRDNLSCLSVSNEESQARNYEADLKVCECLTSRFNVPIKKKVSELSTQELEARNKKLEEGKLLASLVELKRNYVSKRDAILLEAHFISNEQILSLNNIAKTQETPNFFKHKFEQFKGKVSDEVLSKALESIDSRDQYKTVLDNLNDKTKHPESCFPYADYLKVSMLPESSLFWAEILNKKEYNFEDWNYYSVLEKFNNSQGNEKKLAEAKLDFLNRNPTLKSLFGSLNKKLGENLYKDMRKVLNPSAGCVKDNSCRSEFFEKGGNLHQSLKAYYEDPENRTTHIGQTFSEMTDVISDLVNPDVHKELVIPTFRLAYNNSDLRYSECNSSVEPKDAPECVDMLKNYCSELYIHEKEMLPNLQKKEDEKTYTNNWIKDLEAIPAENENYLKFQDLMCDKLARSYPFSNKVMNLEGFKKDYCPKNPQECEGLDDAKLFKLFVSKTKTTNKVFNDSNELVEDTSGLHKLAQANSENKTAVRQMDEKVLEEVKTANSISNLNKPSSDSAPSIRELIGCTDCSSTGGSRGSDISISEHASVIGYEEPAKADSNSQSVFANAQINQPFLSNNVGNIANEAVLSDARNELSTLKKEEQAIKKEITQVKEELNSSPTSPNSSALESRLQNLEKLLAEKEKTSQSYQSLITKLLESNKEGTSPKKAKEPVEVASFDSEVIEGTRKTSSATVASNRPTNLNDEQHAAQRAPASVETFSTSGSAMLGGAGAIGSFSSLGTQAMKSGGGKINSALLSKYGIMVQENANSSVAVAQEAEANKFQTFGAFKEASNIPLEVSPKAFEKFKVNDLSALQELYKESLENIQDDVVKILVSNANSKETLEFYAIKEEGKVVFQPIRKMKLTDLQNVLTRY